MNRRPGGWAGGKAHAEGTCTSPEASGSGLWILASVVLGCPASWTHSSILSPLPDPPSPDSPTETFAAPTEVRHFTDGSFPPGFVLQLFSHTQLRTSDSKAVPKDGRAAEGGLPQPESPSPGELLREDNEGGRQGL